MLSKQKWGSEVSSRPVKFGVRFYFYPYHQESRMGPGSSLWAPRNASLFCVWIPLPDCLFCFQSLPQMIPHAPISPSLRAVHHHWTSRSLLNTLHLSFNLRKLQTSHICLPRTRWDRFIGTWCVWGWWGEPRTSVAVWLNVCWNCRSSSGR